MSPSRKRKAAKAKRRRASRAAPSKLKSKRRSAGIEADTHNSETPGRLARDRAAVERARAEAALKAGEEKYRTLFSSIDQGFCVIEVIFDEAGDPADYLFLEANPAFEGQTGLVDAVGKRVRELVPGHEQFWFETYGRIARTGKPERFEHRAEALGRWYDVYAFRIGAAGDRRVAVLFNDIMERKHAETALRESEARLAIELADARQLHRISSSLIVKDGVDALYAVILEVARSLMRSEMASIQKLVPERRQLFLLAQHGLAPESAEFWRWVTADSTTSCGVALARGDPVIVPDVETWDLVAGTEDLRHYRLSRIRSMLSAPLVSRDGRLVGVMSTHWREVHEPSERELRLFDVLARQAADLIERTAADVALRESEERQAFLLKLSDALRPLADPARIQDTAMRVLGEHLGVLRAQYYDLEPDDEHLVSAGGYARGAPPVTGRVRMDDFGAYVRESFRAGRTLAVADVSADDRVSEAELAAYDALGFRAFVGVPLVKEGRFVVAVGIHHARPHDWTDAEVAIIEETAERTWAAVERARAEQELRVREAELAQVQRIGGVGGIDIDIAGGMVGRRSPEYLRLHGLPPEAALETHADWLRRLHPADRDRANKTFLGALAGPRSDYECEYRIVRPSDGEERWIFAKADIERDDAGRPLRMIGAHIDITERKRAEAALQRSADTFYGLIQNAPFGIYVVDADFRLAEASLIARRVFGGLVDPLIGADLALALRTIWPEPFAGEAIGRFRRTLETGEPFVASDTVEQRADRDAVEAYDWRLERIVMPDGRFGVVCYFYDLSDRLRLEGALRENEARLRHIVDSAVEYAIITLDRDGCIRSWNAGAERLLGYTEAEAVGQSGEIFFSPEDRAAGEPWREMQRARQRGRAANERWHYRKDGSRFWGSGVMLFSDGSPDMFLKIFRDRTEERRAEERQHVLINELNHRVKNTLATVQAIALQTFRGNVKPAVRDNFEARLRALAAGHDVLTEESWGRADLRQIVTTALRPFEALGEGRLKIEGPGFYIVPKSALALTMALHELATNATKYGALSNHGGRVSVRWQVVSGDEPRLELRWKESGGPPVTAPHKKGFGSRLIERSLAGDLGADVRIEYEPTGVVCTFDAPVESLRGAAPTVELMIGRDWS